MKGAAVTSNALQPVKQSSIESTGSGAVQVKVTLDDPIVKRLFRPFIHADFQPDPVQKTSKGEPLPPQIDKAEHKWLYEHAIMFGLHPERDLNIPPLPKADIVRSLDSFEDDGDELLDEPIDKRLAAELQRFAEKRREKEDRQRKRQQKQNERLLKEGKVTQEELDEQEAVEYEKPYLPLKLRPQQDQLRYKNDKLRTVEHYMSRMDKTIADWRQRRREQRLKIKESKKAL